MYWETGTGGAAAAAPVIVGKAIKASGAIINVEPGEFKEILQKAGPSLVVKAKGGFLKPNFQYLTSYKGFIIFTKSKTEITFTSEVEFINAREIWIPD